MKKRMSWFSVLSVIVLLVFAVFMFWYIPSYGSLLSKTAETRQALETSIGREGKQQDEYDKAVADLPVVQAELKEKQPLAEEAAQKVTDLKARRKELRAEKKALEEAQNPENQEESQNPDQSDASPDASKEAATESAKDGTEKSTPSEKESSKSVTTESENNSARGTENTSMEETAGKEDTTNGK